MVDLNTLESWSETASSNDNIGGISIAENATQVSDLNNALREFMAQEAAWLGDDTLASASTTDLGSVPGRYVTITGTTTITAFGTIKAGTIKYVKFSGALTLTHNATSLILDGGANITTAAGDKAAFVSEGSGNWRMLWYQRAASTPYRSNAWEYIGEFTASAGAAIAVTGLSAYKTIRISGQTVPGSDNQEIYLQTSTDNGSTYASTSGDYVVQSTRSNGTSVDGVGNSTAPGLPLALTQVGNQTPEGVNFEVVLTNFNTGRQCKLFGGAAAVNGSGALFTETVSGARLDTTARNALRIIAATGNITGDVRVEGIRS